MERKYAVKRAAIAYVADVDARRMDLLHERDQLPFGRNGSYTLEEAFQLCLHRDLTENQGLGHEAAVYLITNAIRRDKLDKHPLNTIPEHGQDVWAAAGDVIDPNADPAENRCKLAVAGALADLPQLIAAQLARQHPGCQFYRMTMVNASRAARQVRQRALDLGLPEAIDFSLVWNF